MASLIYGIAIALKHAGVRFLLWVDGQTPIYYTDFLNYAARRVLLHKVGRGYLFMHRLLQDYFSTRNADKHY
jgi:hypothetical protein